MEGTAPGVSDVEFDKSVNAALAAVDEAICELHRAWLAGSESQRCRTFLWIDYTYHDFQYVMRVMGREKFKKRLKKFLENAGTDALMATEIDE